MADRKPSEQDRTAARELSSRYHLGPIAELAIAQALASARAEAIASRDKEWAAAFHRGDWVEGEPDMTLEAFQRHGDTRRGTFNEIARVCHEQGVQEGLEMAARLMEEEAPDSIHFRDGDRIRALKEKSRD